MKKPIRRTAVIGAGVMGSGIAAHFANAGLEVLLLDIVPPNVASGPQAGDKDKSKRDAWAAGGLEKALKARPAAFFHKDNARLVNVGNVEDDLDKLKDCDLVIEAIIEKMEAKQALFEKLEKIVPPHCIVASNTSGLRIAEMTKGRSANFKKHFLVLHFFNPVRYMKLLEIVSGPETDEEVVAHAVAFAEDTLGKGVVFGKDTPNFVGNRIGAHAMMVTIHQMLEDGLSPEDVDNITGSPMAHPKSASFRTADLVGLDTFVHVADNCESSLTEDEDRKVFEVPAYIRKMVEKKLLGDKTKGGFFKRGADKQIQTLDPKTLEYRAKGGDDAIKAVTKTLSKIEDPRARVKQLVADQGKTGEFARKVLYKSLSYSARRIFEIADSVVAIDNAMKWGYNWELGPFEVWDALGFVETADAMEKAGHKLPESVKKMKESGAKSFYTADGKVFDLLKGEYVTITQDPRYATLAELRKGKAGHGPAQTRGCVLENDGAEAWDLGDGVLGLTFKTKANSIDPDVISMIGQAVEKAETDFRALVIANEGEHFCVGANLLLVVMSASQGQFDQIGEMVRGYQYATQRMKYARVPVIAAPYGMTLGGGLELCFGSDGVQAAAETYAGLVEVGVGLIPGGAGTLNMLWRALEAIPEGTNVGTYEFVTQTFKNIALVKISTSAEEAKALGYFRRTDGISFDRARQIADAKARAIGLADSNYHPPVPRAYRLPGESGIATLGMMVDTLVAGGYASEHDAKIARKLAVVLCGGVGGAARDVTEDDILDLEREAFLSLCGEPKSQERMQFMLMNNKPLRN
jgi:3-hydroxyacyl-CoA dehydrogenase